MSSLSSCSWIIGSHLSHRGENAPLGCPSKPPPSLPAPVVCCPRHRAIPPSLRRPAAFPLLLLRTWKIFRDPVKDQRSKIKDRRSKIEDHKTGGGRTKHPKEKGGVGGGGEMGY